MRLWQEVLQERMGEAAAARDGVERLRDAKVERGGLEAALRQFVLKHHARDKGGGDGNAGCRGDRL